MGLKPIGKCPESEKLDRPDNEPKSRRTNCNQPVVGLAKGSHESVEGRREHHLPVTVPLHVWPCRPSHSVGQ